MFFEFQLLFIRLAWEGYPKDLERKDLKIVLERYIKYLYLRKNEELQTVPLPDLHRKMTNKMKEYYKIINNEIHSEGERPQTGSEQLTPFELLAIKMQKELVNAPALGLDFPDIMKTLER